MTNHEEIIYQILTYSNHGLTVLHDWKTTKAEAEESLKDAKEFHPNKFFWIEEGSEYIYTRCNCCGTVHCTERTDYYGISTGFWCDDCYDSENYTYRKDEYFDPMYAGERLEDEY